MAVSAPATLSHYTDAVGAVGILQDEEFWATHALFLNDATELVSAEPIVQQACDVALAGVDPYVKSRFVRDFWSGYRESDHNAQAHGPELYVTCFCQESDLLSQWRAYGNFGGGYSIQFDFQILVEQVRAASGLDLLPVIYDRGAQLAQLVDLVTAGVELIPALEKPTESIFLAQLRTVARITGSAASQLALQIKDAAFAEEKEWRLIYTPPYDLFFAPEPDEMLVRRFRATARGIVPFVRVPTDWRRKQGTPSLAKFPVTGVTVGPTASTEMAERALTLLLEDRGGSRQPVIRSSIPLRA